MPRRMPSIEDSLPRQRSGQEHACQAMLAVGLSRHTALRALLRIVRPRRAGARWNVRCAPGGRLAWSV